MEIKKKGCNYGGIKLVLKAFRFYLKNKDIIGSMLEEALNLKSRLYEVFSQFPEIRTF